MGENGEMMQVEDNVLSFQSKAIQFGASNRTVLIRRLHNKPPYMIHRSYYISTEEQKSNKVKNPFKKNPKGQLSGPLVCFQKGVCWFKSRAWGLSLTL